MTWKTLLKAHCMAKMGRACSCEECEKQQFEKTLVGNQKKIDANKDGKITGEDFAMLRNKAQIECPKCKGKGCEHCNYKGYHNSPIKKGQEEFTTDTSKDKGIDVWIKSPKNIDIFSKRVILKWNGSIEVYDSGFGAITSFPQDIDVEIEYMHDDDEKEYRKELSFSGKIKGMGKGNPQEIQIDIDFSDVENPKITKVEVTFGKRFNEE